MPILYPQSHQAAVRLLQLAGCEVWFPPDERCCGALFAHNGDLDFAERLRDSNTRMYMAGDFDALVVDSAGCGAHLKDFYPELKGRVKDLTEWLVEVGLPEPNCEMRHADICCGAAGLYSTLEPAMSNRILQEKLDDLLGTRADMVVTANPGCQMQLGAGLRSRGSVMKVEHIAELLLRAY
jgi:glycolate oxidase iron-sulfur subunit